MPFSSPFDPSAIDLLEDLGVELYKTASAEIVDLPLIRQVAGTGKPMVMSTGMATMREIAAAVEAASGAGCTELVLLACTASYPADPADARLQNIALLAEAFGVPVGLSDHTLGVAVVRRRGRARGGLPREARHPRPRRRRCRLGLLPGAGRADAAAHRDGGGLAGRAQSARIGPTESEQSVLRLRRSLYVVEDVRAGDEVTDKNVRSIRPAGGLPPDALTAVLGRRFSSDVSRGTPLDWDLV